MQRWYITFHGGSRSHDWNNIHAFDLSGKPVGKMLDTTGLPRGMELRELRGFAFGNDGDLYVSNAWEGGSHILRFSGSLNDRGRHEFREVFVEQHASNPALSHPFDVTFGSDGHLFVPSQDTNVVTRYFGPTASTSPGAPMPVPPAIRALGLSNVPPGTFVPSHRHADHGLMAVRGIAFGPDGNLFVVDRDENAVKIYDGRSGHHVKTIRHRVLASPIHILPQPDSRRLLVGSRDRHAIIAIDVDTGECNEFITSGSGGLRSPGGFAFGPDGNLYVASRDTRRILRYHPESGIPDNRPFIADLHDLPEFLRLVDGN